MTENIVVIGATSGMARALCAVLAKRGCRLVLAGRDTDELRRVASDLQLRYETAVVARPFEALDFSTHNDFVDECVQHFDGNLDAVVLCYGYMADQERTEQDFGVARQMIDVNFTSPVSVLNQFARHFERQERGLIAAISSVAGDRGRQSNYTYGSAKAGLSAYLQGLRNRLYRSGVAVLTIKPGFVLTPMTEDVLDPKSALVARPERVARDIDRAIRGKANVLYTPWFWWGIMKVIKLLPETIFKRMRL